MRVEFVGVLIFALSCVCMSVPVVCDLYGCGIHTTFAIQFAAFLGFEMCVGAFQPCVATHRSKYVPDGQQSTVNNLFRFPLNMLVAAGTVLSDYFPSYLIFAMCASAHGLAMACQLQLAYANPQSRVVGDAVGDAMGDAMSDAHATREVRRKHSFAKKKK